MKKGDLIFVRHNSWVGKRIRSMTNCTFNHVGIFINDKEIVEARFTGVEKTNIDKYKEYKNKGKLDYIICEIIDIEAWQINELINLVTRQIGKRYDFLQTLCIGLFIILGINLKIEPIDLRNNWMCSELIGELAANVGIIFNKDVELDRLTPAHIYWSKKVKVK